MNPRQRRGVLLVALATVGAAVVFAMVAGYVSDVRSRVGPTGEALVLARDVAAYEDLAPDVVERTEVPERWLPANALRDPGRLAGRVSPSSLPAGTVLQEGMLEAPPDLEAGQREIAILVDAEAGVAGKVAPGSVVDIAATFSGDGEDDPPQASFVVERAPVVDVGSPTTAAEEAGGGFAENEVVPVTFALSVEDSLRLAYVESFAGSVRLLRRSPADDGALTDRERVYQPGPGGPRGELAFDEDDARRRVDEDGARRTSADEDDDEEDGS